MTLTRASSNTKLVPREKIVFGGSNPNRTLTITVEPQKNSQSAEITITAKDGGGAMAIAKVTVIGGTDKKETINGTSIADMIFGLNGDDIGGTSAGGWASSKLGATISAFTIRSGGSSAKLGLAALPVVEASPRELLRWLDIHRNEGVECVRRCDDLRSGKEGQSLGVTDSAIADREDSDR